MLNVVLSMLKQILPILQNKLIFHKPETTWMKVLSSICYFITGRINIAISLAENEKV